MTCNPVVIIGYGNPSRGDDALGPEFLRHLENTREQGVLPPIFDTITDFQLQIEHAVDLQQRQLVLFVDASVSATPPFEFHELTPRRDESYSSHAMTPAAVLEVFTQFNDSPPPPAFLLTIPGKNFELGTKLSQESESYLKSALEHTVTLLRSPNATIWRGLCS
ncbi:hydrogenase maturation protease [Solemya velesiana gill symbiont]|uniref:Ni/Fe hydrogenase n=1 Tax=Solemya velesiana gill symbiont TaxID=1918948 RepID=A0A1T2KWJ1_9GAMM|nr:hydrogenase maturation protease [Solemya velesiana gill symbiont]OOZ37120.1 hypothetical protein BOW51_03810 [Solemya velesiana gill symbiont]